MSLPTTRRVDSPRSAVRVLAPRRERGGWLLGCGISLGVVLLLFVACSVTVWMNKEKLMGAGVEMLGHAAIDGSTLPQDQKDALKLRVTAMKTEFVAGNLTLEELETFGNALADSPLLFAGGIQVAKDVHLVSSGLSVEEKAQGAVQLNRVARGLFEGAIDVVDARALLEVIGTTNGSGEWEPKEQGQVTDEELRAMIEQAQALADDAGVATDEDWTIDFAAQFDALVEETLGRPLELN